MKTATQRVIYRRWNDTADVIAFLPDQYENNGCIGSYMHVGQHGAAVYPNRTHPAFLNEADTAALHKELQQIYDDTLRVVKRLSRKVQPWK